MLKAQAIPTWPIPTTVTLLVEQASLSATSDKSCSLIDAIYSKRNKNKTHGGRSNIFSIRRNYLS